MFREVRKRGYTDEIGITDQHCELCSLGKCDFKLSLFAMTTHERKSGGIALIKLDILIPAWIPA